MTTDTPTTAAEMREAAEAILRDWEGQAEEMDARNPMRAQILLEAALLRKCIRPLPSDDEMVEKVALALYNGYRGRSGMPPVDHIGANRTPACETCRLDARAAIAAMRGTHNGPEPAKGE